MMTETTQPRFDPRPHLVKVKGNQDYLEVKWRLVWFRAECPNGVIATELISLDAETKLALFRATVAMPDGGSATGYGSETASDFADYIEKAETKAIGRALAALGYGTQFATDHDMSNADGTPHFADSPIDIAASRSQPPNADGRVMAGQSPSARQFKFMYALAGELGLSDEQLAAECFELFGVDSPTKMSRKAVSDIIARLQQPREARPDGDVVATAIPSPQLDDRWIARLNALMDAYLATGGVAGDYLALVRAQTGGSPEFRRLTKQQATDVARQIEAMTVARTDGDVGQ